jgi:hypothetical protein
MPGTRRRQSPASSRTARPASLRRCAARLPAGPGSDAGRRNALSIVGARPSREVDRGRHDLCGFAAIPVFHQDLSCHLPRHHGHPSSEPSELDRISAGSRGWWSGVTNATIPFTTCSTQGPVGGQAGGADTRAVQPGWSMEDAMGTLDTPDRQDIHGQAIDRHTDAGQTATSSSWWRLRRRVVGGRRASRAGGGGDRDRRDHRHRPAGLPLPRRPVRRAGHQHSARRAAGHGERDHRRFS